jgi:hypothetical protein
MTKKADNINNYLNTLKGKIIGAIIASIVVCLVGWKDEIIANFDKGQALLEQQEYDTKLDSALVKRFSDYKFMDKFMSSPYMLDWRSNEREKLTDEIKHEDATKLKMSAYVSEGAGMDKKAMMDTFVVIMNERKQGKKFVTNSECIKNSKKYGRGQHAMQGI